MFNNSCRATCPNGYFETTSAGIKICSACASYCATCETTAGTCLTCPGSKIMSNNSCLDNCPTQ